MMKEILAAACPTCQRIFTDDIWSQFQRLEMRILQLEEMVRAEEMKNWAHRNKEKH